MEHSARTLSHGAGMIIARPRSSWRRPKETTVSSRTGWPRLGAGVVRSSLSAAGTGGRAMMKRRGCSRVVNPSLSPAGTGHNHSRSSISAEGTAGNSPGIHSWGSGARGDMTSPESRRIGGGSAGLVFRRPLRDSGGGCVAGPALSWGPARGEGTPGNGAPRWPAWGQALGLQERSCRPFSLSWHLPGGRQFGPSVPSGRAHPAKLFVRPKISHPLLAWSGRSIIAFRAERVREPRRMSCRQVETENFSR